MFLKLLNFSAPQNHRTTLQGAALKVVSFIFNLTFVLKSAVSVE